MQGGDTTSPVAVRLLTYNTYLVRPVRIPRTRVAVGGDPWGPERADELAPLLAGAYDVVCLQEVFHPSDVTRLVGHRSDVTAVVGPGRGGRPAVHPSGLLTLVDGDRVVRVARHRFAATGARWRDADALANKGVLLVELDLGDAGRLEVFNTHLLWGGGLVPVGGDAPGIRARQVAELVDFVGAQHRPGNVAVVCGDFNVGGAGGCWSGDGREHEALVGRLDTLGFRDLWAAHGHGPGWSCDLRVAPDGWVEPDPADGRFLDDEVEPPAPPTGDRLDYVFLHEPDRGGPVCEVEVVRRRHFPRAHGAPGPMRHLSDHAGLHVELRVGRVG